MRLRKIAAVAVLALAGATLLPVAAASAYAPTKNTVYQLPDTTPCLKARGNCVIYAKAAQTATGRIVASFEQASVPSSGTAVGETLPVYKSDDDGATWQHLSEVQAPAFVSNDPAVAKYTSAWGNPYPYVMPQTVGNLTAGTLLMPAVVTGEDEYYAEQKAANPNYVPTQDGSRRDTAIALYKSTDDGATWQYMNIIATGGWSSDRSNANTTKQQDPVWEPYLMVFNNQLVAYYSDENDITGYDATTGVPTVASNNLTGPEDYAQILAHKTWNGNASAAWSQAVVDVAGDSFTFNGGTRIGGGRPGMENIVPTSDGKWLLTYEYWGGGDNVRYKVADNPLEFFKVGGSAGTNISNLPVEAGSGALATGGSPVLMRLPSGAIIYNANGGGGQVWINRSGSSTGAWTAYQTTLPATYSRNLSYDARTGRVIVMGNGNAGEIISADIDFGNSAGTYYQLVNKKTGQVVGTGNHTNDANIGNSNTPDVRLESAGSAAITSTQFWKLETKSGGGVSLLNESGGRSGGIWTGNATAGQGIGQWVDDSNAGPWNVVSVAGGYVRFQSRANSNLYLTGSTPGSPLTLQATTSDGSQEWLLSGGTRITSRSSGLVVDVQAPNTQVGSQTIQTAWASVASQQWEISDLGNGYSRVLNENSGLCLDVNAASTSDGARVQQWTCSGSMNQQWQVQTLAGGYVQFVARQSGKCLDVDRASNVSGTKIQQWTCSGSFNQQWLVTAG